jgi:hypothetical protein
VPHGGLVDQPISSGGNVSASGRLRPRSLYAGLASGAAPVGIKRIRIGPVVATLPKGASVARVHTRLVIFGAESVARVQEFCLKAAELRGVAS